MHLLQEKEKGTVRVFTEADFELVDYEYAGLTKDQFEQYKKEFLGRPVPSQTTSTAALLALGYEPPDAWVQCLLEERLPNWA